MISNKQFQSYVALFQSRVDSTPDQPALCRNSSIVEEARSLTYAQLDRLVRRLAAAIQEKGVTSGRPVMIWLSDPLEIVPAYLACLHAGLIAVICPASDHEARDRARLEGIYDDCLPHTLITTQSRFQHASSTMEGFGVESILIDDELPPESAWRPPWISSGDVAHLQYTSGSTSHPKGVMITHGSLLANLDVIADGFQGTSEDRGILWLPLYHDMGLLSVLYTLAIGAVTEIYAPRWFVRDPLRWLRRISEFRATISGGPDFAYRMCARLPIMTTLDLSSWRLAYCGGESVRASTFEALKRALGPHGFQPRSFYPCYGLAEATLMVTGGELGREPRILDSDQRALTQGWFYPANGRGNRCLVSSGKPRPGMNIIIVDETTSCELSEGQVGEIWIEGASVAAGYWNRENELSPTFQAFTQTGAGPYLRTGDRGMMHDGELYVTGRLKDLIIVNGTNYWSEDIETTVTQSLDPGMGHESAVFAHSVDERDQIVVVQELSPRCRNNFDETMDRIRLAILRTHGISPDHILLTRRGVLPRTTSGKLQRQLCRSLFEQNQLQPIIARWIAGPISNQDTESDSFIPTTGYVNILSPKPLNDDTTPRLSPTNTYGAPHGPEAQWTLKVLQHQVSIEIGSDTFRLDGETELADIGLDSIQALRVAQRLRGSLRRDVSPELFYECRTLRELADRVRELPGVFAETTTSDQDQHRASIRSDDPAEDYRRYVRPRRAEFLSALRLDPVYHAAKGDHLTWFHDDQEREVLDLVGGFGSTILGHNHPELISTFQLLLASNTPQHVQASIPQHATALAAMLSKFAERELGRAFLVNLFSTGAEVVEASMRHAELAWTRRVDRYQQHADRSLRLARRRNEQSSCFTRLQEEWYQASSFKSTPNSWEELLADIEAHNCEVLRRKPVFAALDVAFHGRTAGAYRLTDHPADNDGGILRLQSSDSEQLSATLAAYDESLYWLQGESTDLRLISQSFNRIMAIYVEPIRCEGGIHRLPAAFASRLRQASRFRDIPIVADEIQTGLGRTGAMFASKQVGIEASYYLLGKSLGGGLAKISALLIDRDQYHADFSLHHGSTFAEDNHSALIARKALELIHRTDAPGRARTIGQTLGAGLKEVAAAFPDVVADVREFGCLLGFELRTGAGSPSALIRFLGDRLGYVVSSYLLNHHSIRVLPSLSAPLTLRIEPSAMMLDESIKQVIDGFSRVCNVLHRGAAGELIQHLAVGKGEKQHDTIASDTSRNEAPANTQSAPLIAPLEATVVRTGTTRSQHSSPGSKVLDDTIGRIPTTHVGFLTYCLSARELSHWDPSLSIISPHAIECCITRLSSVLSSAPARQFRVVSSTGKSVDVTIYAMCVTGEQIRDEMETGSTDVLERLQETIHLAARDGCHTVGLGGALSILARNGKAVATPSVNVTTGNSLTVAIALQGLFDACTVAGVDVRRATSCVVGAGGNIGTTFAAMLSHTAHRLILISRDQRGAIRTAREIFRRSLARVRQESQSETQPLSGIAESLLAWSEAHRISLTSEDEAIWKEFSESNDAPIQISLDLSDLQDTDIVATCTSALTPVIQPQHLSRRVRVLCDVAVPSDVSVDVTAEFPELLVVRGGVVRVPNAGELTLGLAELPPGCVFACLAETILLGLEEFKGDFSLGDISEQNVRDISEIATRHGFVREPTAGV